MVGKQFGRYRVVEKIGAGGMGEVYRARDEQLERDPEFQKFMQEFRQQWEAFRAGYGQ